MEDEKQRTLEQKRERNRAAYLKDRENKKAQALQRYYDTHPDAQPREEVTPEVIVARYEAHKARNRARYHAKKTRAPSPCANPEPSLESA
jgi:hypothetical protein